MRTCKLHRAYFLHPDSRSYDDVREQVRTLAGYWPGLASVLGLSPSVIREIEATHRLPAKCLDDAIGRWLHENYKVERFGLPSWMALVKAVEDRNGGRNPALAKKIAQEHPRECYSPDLCSIHTYRASSNLHSGLYMSFYRCTQQI